MLEKDIKNLIKILEESNIDEMEVSTFWGKQNIRIRKNVKTYKSENIEIIHDNTDFPVISRSDLHQPKEDKNISDLEDIDNKTSEIRISDENNTACIKAPLVGTFYRSAKPEDPPFISEGDNIEKGQVVCIIEAMKIFNEIESELSGKVEKFLITDSSPVEYDQDLIVISPD